MPQPTARAVKLDDAFVAYRFVRTSGAIGAPLFVHCANRNPSVPSHYTSDMTLSDTTVHDSDVVRWLLYDEVVAQSVLQPRRNRRGGDLRDPIPNAGREPEPAVGPTAGFVTVPAALPHALGWHILGLQEPASRNHGQL